MVDLIEISAIATLVVGFSIVSFAIWNASKRMSTVEANQRAQDEQQSKDLEVLKDHISELKISINGVETDVVAKIFEQRAERKEEIAKALVNQHERFILVQTQIDTIKSDIKDMASRVTVVDTKAIATDKEIERLCDDIDALKGFVVDWNQRIEDRIKDTNNYLFKIASNDVKVSKAPPQ